MSRAIIDALESSGRGYAQRLVIKEAKRIIVLNVDEVEFIEAAGSYVCLHREAKTHILRETMTRLGNRLDPARFVRIHRSTIVRVSCIRELLPTLNGAYIVRLQSGAEVTCSRRYRRKLAKVL